MMHTYSMTKHVSKFLAAAGALVLLLLAVAVAPLFASAEVPSQRVPSSRMDIEMTFAPLVKQSSPSVVNIYTRKRVSERARAMADFFGRVPPQGQNSLGSGVIVGSDGVIVTNYHVIEDADDIRVVLSDRREYEAELVLGDERTDLAVLRIDTGGARLPTLPYADTRGVEVGDLVLAIGNPFGVGQTVTSGIISATARTDVGISDYAFFLQTDAAVNPGNSGGALVNTRGELVGVNSAIYSRSGGSNGIGFAIPSEMVRRVVDAAVNEGTLVRPWLGLKGQSVSFDVAQTQGLDRPIGVIVTEVYKGGPADRAGLKRGDLVTMIDDREVYDEKGLKFLAAVNSPGERVRLTVLRGGHMRTKTVTLAPPPGASEADVVLLDGHQPFSGAAVVELSPRLAEENGMDPISKGQGIYVYKVQRRSIARSFVRPGDIILSVNGHKVKTVRELQSVLSHSDGSWQIDVVDRNGRRRSGTVRL